MPAKKKADPVVEVEAAPAGPARWELEDEFHLLIAQGNPKPARLVELKALLSGPLEGEA